MMYDALAYERQRQEQADIRRCVTHKQGRERKAAEAREHRRLPGVLRRRLSVTASF